jgi:hypothetical protein
VRRERAGDTEPLLADGVVGGEQDARYAGQVQ